MRTGGTYKRLQPRVPYMNPPPVFDLANVPNLK